MSIDVNTKFALRSACMGDVPALTEFEQLVWGSSGASADQLESRITNYAHGNVIAENDGGEVVSYASFCLLDYQYYAARGATSWYDLSGNGTASTHEPRGRDLFGINLGASPTAGRGVSQSVLFEVVRRGVCAGARRGILGARVPDFHKFAASMSINEYVTAERAPGEPLDPELRYYSKFGMRPVEVVRDYFDDPPSLNWGVLVEMTAPWYLRASAPLLKYLPLDWSRVTRLLV